VDQANFGKLPRWRQTEKSAKQMVHFEDSGHGMIWQEPDLFHGLMINTVLAETYSQ